MSKELPLKVRMDIRDLWDSSTSSVTESVSSLNKVLGHTITPRVEWPILWAELKTEFTDNSAFVPLVVRYTIAWYERLIGRLENDRHADWTDQLLNVITEGANRKALTLHIEPAERIPVPSTKWNAKLATFQLCVPKAEPVSQTKLDSTYDKCFENLFNADAKDADWDDLAVEAPISVAQRSGAISPSDEAQTVIRLPVLDAIARPPDLFKTSGPHILIVEERVPHIIVQSSHEPSLELLAAYLNKWGKSNPNDSQKRSILKAELIESEYFYGVMDTLAIERNMGRRDTPLNPTLVLAFIEGVMGYKLTNTTGSCRTYVSATLLK
ncbi:hypothetical protein C8R47DRAFT_500782 [Mycena vitilis]|nr:hypothetical protein C8R47DRAFT_500782 [Mycena vitilis]